MVKARTASRRIPFPECRAIGKKCAECRDYWCILYRRKQLPNARGKNAKDAKTRKSLKQLKV